MIIAKPRVKQALLMAMTVMITGLCFSQAQAAQLTTVEKNFLSAVNDGRLAQAKKALDKKVNINVQDEKGETALIKAVANDNESLTHLLLKNKADVNLKDGDGNTALFYAVSNKNSKLTKQLIDAKADVKQVYGEKKETVLFEAARANAADEAKMLLKKDKTLGNILNTEGQNALFAAAELGNLEVSKELVKTLNPNLKDKAGKTAKDVAREAGFQKTLDALSVVSH